jgi:hypothetical protein
MDQSLLAGWENFYVITGSSAGALIGLTFVIVTLVADAKRVSPDGFVVFVTPTVVHFGVVLAMAAFMSVPHQRIASLSVGFGFAGIAGLSYCGYIAARMRRPSSPYASVREDWIFNVIVPAVLYAVLLCVAALVWRELVLALYGAAAVSLVLLFTGIRNAWDIAVYMTINKSREPD